MIEEWREIAGQSGRYYVSNTGKVKSFIKTSTGRILSPSDNGKGYLSVQLGRRHRCYIHTLVLTAFIGASDLEINHKDLNKANNNLTNLEYVTRKYNQQHMIRNGKHNRAKLNLTDRLEIKRLRMFGVQVLVIAKHFDISKSTVSSVANNTTWGWE